MLMPRTPRDLLEPTGYQAGRVWGHRHSRGRLWNGGHAEPASSLQGSETENARPQDECDSVVNRRCILRTPWAHGRSSKEHRGATGLISSRKSDTFCSASYYGQEVKQESVSLR